MSTTATTTNHLHEEITRLYLAGVPSSHIARRLKCPRAVVNYVIKKRKKEEYGETD